MTGTVKFLFAILAVACCPKPLKPVFVPTHEACMDPAPVIGLAPFPAKPDADGTYHVAPETVRVIETLLFYLEAQIAKCGERPSHAP